jgi:hypothetical protein
VRYIIAHTLVQAKSLEADPRVVDACLLYDTFTVRQKVFAFICWRLPLLRIVTRVVFRRRFFNPYATIVFALREPKDVKAAP